MLYDEVKKLIKKTKLPANFKNEMLFKTNLKMEDIDITAKESITAMQVGINEATVILIEDNKKIFEEIENIKIEQFKEIKFPFSNFFIEFNLPNPQNPNNSNDIMTIGLHVFPDNAIGLKSDNIYNILMYSMKNNRPEQLVPLMSILKLDKLPRFYIGCYDKCDKIINPSKLGSMLNKEVCQRTERTADQCNFGSFLLFGIKVVIYTVNLINSKPKKLLEESAITDQVIKSKQVTNKSKSVNNSHSRKVQSKYIYIQVDKPKQRKNVRVTRGVTGTRKSPIPHTRRGHFRKLKSGKVIWIEMSYVGLKEKANKKIYKIK